MFSLSVLMGPISLRFLFRDQKKAESFKGFRNNHPTQDLIIDDDFGQHAELRAASIDGIVIENLEESKNGAVETLIHNAKVQAQAGTRARAEPALTNGRMPPVISPFSQ